MKTQIKCGVLLLFLMLFPAASLVAAADTAATPMARLSRDAGLELVGTIMAAEPASRAAIIYDVAADSQRLFRIGEEIKAGIVIKDIGNNRAVVNTDSGDRMLVMLLGSGPANGRETTPVTASSPFPRQSSAEGGGTDVRLSRQTVADAVPNLDRFMQRVSFSPVMSYGRSDGLMVSHLPPDSVLSLTGLKNGQVLVRANGQQITRPEQVAALLERFTQGGEFTIDVRKPGVRKRTRTVHIEIN